MHTNGDKTKDASFFFRVVYSLNPCGNKISSRSLQTGPFHCVCGFNIREEISSNPTKRIWVYFGKHGGKTENDTIRQNRLVVLTPALFFWSLFKTRNQIKDTPTHNTHLDEKRGGTCRCCRTNFITIFKGFPQEFSVHCSL